MASFVALRAFNDPALSALAGSRRLVGDPFAALFPGDALPHRLVRALCDRRALPLKELLESFEFWARVRRSVRAPVLADLCCGHGLTGVLFAVMERKVERVVLVDRRRPASHARVLAAAVEVAPWTAAKVEYREEPLAGIGGRLPPGTAIVAVHACGVRTDRCIDGALVTGGALAVLPCCYAQTAARAPAALREALGAELATDVHRTYRLENAGRAVRWGELPRPVTARNRLIVAGPGT